MTNSVPSEGSAPQKDPTHPEGSWEAIRKWFEKNRSQVLFFLGGLALYLLLGLFLWWLLQLYVEPSVIKDPSKEATAKKDLLQALGLIMAGVAGAIGIFFTWRGQRLAREAQEHNQRNTQEQISLARQGQITERFTRAIEQLGASEGDKKSLEIRIGGIFALERLANESKEDYGAIMEVLTAYVRRQARRNRQEVSSEQVVTGKFPSAPFPSADIQAILTVIGRRARTEEIEQQELLDLHDTDLHGAQLSRVQLGRRSGANLRHCVLVGADLRGALLPGADFYGAYLRGADFSGAYLSRADLSGVLLRGADLYRANLQGANLQGANLQEANLQEANLQEANLQEANLQGANLYATKFTDQQLADVQSLQGATMPDGSEHP